MIPVWAMLWVESRRQSGMPRSQERPATKLPRTAMNVVRAPNISTSAAGLQRFGFNGNVDLG
jgi:hypothetical protein